MNVLQKYWKIGYASMASFVFGMAWVATGRMDTYRNRLGLRLLLCTFVSILWPLNAVGVLDNENGVSY